MKPPYERITADPKFDDIRDSHELRYHIANGFIEENDYVVDAGCGTQYGGDIMKGIYTGLDKLYGFDLEKDEYKHKIDVFVSFEAIEHLETLDNFIRIAKTAKKWIVVSTPIIPTVGGGNIYHKQDFTEDRLTKLFVDKDFKLYGWLKQNEIYGIFIFKRINF